jgi:hypothetical protein
MWRGRRSPLQKGPSNLPANWRDPHHHWIKQRLDCAIEGSLIGSKAKKRAGRLAVPVRIIRDSCQVRV